MSEQNGGPREPTEEPRKPDEPEWDEWIIRPEPDAPHQAPPGRGKRKNKPNHPPSRKRPRPTRPPDH